MMTSDEQLLSYAQSFQGVPYKYGGSNPMEGIDCSGYVVELLQAAGVLPEKSDFTAQGLYHKFRASHVPVPRLGALVFFGKNAQSVVHVGFCTGPHFMLEAGGGTSSTTNRAEAEARDAFVRLRPILNYRRDLLRILEPNYFWRG